MADILVLGVGNILQTDDGVGVRVIEQLRRADLPPGVELFDGGTASLDLLDVISDRQKIIIVDAVQGGGEPGSIYRFAPSDVEIEPHSIASLHQLGLLETLKMAQYLGHSAGCIVIFGIEPKVIDWGMELSPKISRVVPEVAARVLEEARRSIISDCARKE